jgi:hypothetical protein
MKLSTGMAWALVALAIVSVGLPAEAQRGGVGGGGLGGGGLGGGYGGYGTVVPPPRWADSLESSFGQEKPVILYVQPPTEGEDVPGAFKNPEISKASRESALFVRIPFKSGDPVIKEHKITAPPCLLGFDWFGNEWHRSTSISQSVIKEYLHLIPEEVARYGEMVEKLLAQAKAREEKEDPKGALSIYRKLAQERRKGFPAIATGREKFKSLGDKALQDAVTLLGTKERDGISELNALSSSFAGTPVGAAAKLALLKHGLEEAKDLRSRILEIQKLAALEGPEMAEVVTAAKALLEQIEGYGQVRIQDAKKKADRGDVDAAKTLLRQIMGDFPGLKVATQAKEDLAKL